jgi:hypothetical protein
MNKTQALAAMVEVARIGRGMTPADALTHLGELIAQESPDDPAHDAKVEQLLRLGACIWSLRRGLFLPEPSGRSNASDALPLHYRLGTVLTLPETPPPQRP